MSMKLCWGNKHFVASSCCLAGKLVVRHMLHSHPKLMEASKRVSANEWLSAVTVEGTVTTPPIDPVSWLLGQAGISLAKRVAHMAITWEPGVRSLSGHSEPCCTPQ